MVCYTDISSEEEQKVLNCCTQILHQQCYVDLLRKGIFDQCLFCKSVIPLSKANQAAIRIRNIYEAFLRFAMSSLTKSGNAWTLLKELWKAGFLR